MAGSAQSKPRWLSPHWSRCWCSAVPVSRRSRCRCGVSTPRGRRPGWRRVGIRRPRWRPPVSPRRGLRPMCDGTAGTSSPESLVVQSSCPASSSSGRPCRPSSRVRDDAGAATALAAVLVAALVMISLGGVWLGTAQIARHRAQMVADLAALAAAARLSLGPDAACQQARYLAVAMRATVRSCDLDRLDVVVTVAVPTGGWADSEARAAARAGPAGVSRR